MNNLIEKTFTYRGESRTVYFRELKFGEKIKLARGQKAVVNGGETTMEIEFSAEGERGAQLLQFTLVDTDGRNVYPSVAKLSDETDGKITKLIALAREAQADFAKQEEAGND